MNFISKNIMICGFVLAGFISCGKENSTFKFPDKKEQIPVKIFQISSFKSAQSIGASGLLTTENEGRYAFKNGGVVDRVYVAEGEYFNKGKILASLNATEFESGAEQARAAYEKALRDYNRVNKLFIDSVATTEQLQNAKTALDLAMNQKEIANYNLSHTKLVAEEDGIVLRKIINPGEVAGPGIPVFVTQQRGNSGWVLKVGVSDAQWAGLKVDMEAKVYLDAFENRVFKARVSRLYPAADMQSGTFQAEIKIDEPNKNFAVGMFGKVVITGLDSVSRIKIPHQALIEANGKQGFVFVPTNNSGVKKVSVIVGRIENQYVEILDGLKGVKEIIVGNSAFINENSTIKIIQ